MKRDHSSKQFNDKNAREVFAPHFSQGQVDIMLNVSSKTIVMSMKLCETDYLQGVPERSI